MVNQWIEFIRQYAKDNNISYGCAISEAGPAYRNMKQGGNSKREKIEMESMSMEDVPKIKHPKIHGLNS